MPQTANLETALLKALQLGMHGDTGSVRQYARQLLKRAGTEDSEFRQSLSRLIAEAGASSAGLRSVTSSSASVLGDADAFMHIEQLEAAIPPVLAEEVNQRIREIVVERNALDELLEAGLSPTRSLLLVGPPGVGKTMTARYLSAVMGVPLMTVDLSAVMSRFLGRTGQNLRAALEEARLLPSVCLLDEFDALGKKRDDPTDVGELKRIVTVVLHELETWPEHGLLIAATNHPELLDRAVWRRFDRVVRVALPNGAERSQIVQEVMQRHGHTLDAEALTALQVATEGWSGSDLTRISQEAIRGLVLKRWASLEEGLAQLLIREIASLSDSSSGRDEFVRMAVEEGGLSQRATARLLGISHVTVGKILRNQQAAETP